LEEVLGALVANTTSGREQRNRKALDPWGTAARRSDHIVELKTSAKKAKRTCTHPKKSKINKNNPNAGKARPR